jgi:holo-[acyl-carrier protein] synthase
MSGPDSLRAAVAEFFGVESEVVTDDFPLSGARLVNSIARAKLDAAIRRRTGLRSDAAYISHTYGELEARIFRPDAVQVPETSEASAARPTMLPVPASQPGLSCGIDIEDIESLPETSDYWEDDFYKANFSPAEIAYCVAQDDPREHFAVRWAVKEALAKCDPRFVATGFAGVELVSSPQAAPVLRNSATKQSLPVAVSVSHSARAAVAVVFRGGVSTEVETTDRQRDEGEPTELRKEDANRATLVTRQRRAVWPVAAVVAVVGVSLCALWLASCGA